MDSIFPLTTLELSLLMDYIIMPLLIINQRMRNK